MARRKPDARQVALAEVDTRPRRVAEAPPVDMTTRELGSLAGFFDGKNVYVDLCEICHRPGIRLKDRWYHRQPCVSRCSRVNAPRPDPVALSRLLRWWQWCNAEARRRSNIEVERAKHLETLIWPMQSYLLSQIARADRRHVPPVTECRMIRQAMARTADDSFIEPLEIEEWSAKSTSSAG